MKSLKEAQKKLRSKDMKYKWGWSVLKATEGGEGAEGYKKFMPYLRREAGVMPYVGHSPYMGHVAVGFEAPTKAAARKALKMLKGSFGTVESVAEEMKQVSRGDW